MAKYVLNYTKTGPRTVNCAILDENCLSETYTVQFDNGVIRDVKQRRVKNLDHIDEAVLDRLKKFAKNLIDRVITVGRRVFFDLGGKIARLIPPVNIMAAAEEIPALSFYPSPHTAAFAEENGIDAHEIVNDPIEDEYFLKDANEYLMEIKTAYEKGDEKKLAKLYAVSESMSILFGNKLNEGIEDQSLEHPDWLNVNSEYMEKKIAAQYSEALSGVMRSGKSAVTIVPYCIWGAPGIGKTQIIKNLIDVFRDGGLDADIIEINAMAMRKDDWALPGKKGFREFLKDTEGHEIEYDRELATELAKGWLPAWDPDDVDEKRGITEDMLDDKANGGDGSGNGLGGFFFIDELSRIEPSVLNTIMTLVQNRKFNGLRIGSKWIFVAAANRPSDLGKNKNRFFWDEAQTGRFQHVNFVPTFQEWLKWAEDTNPITGEQHILPILVDFLKENQNVWYNIAMRNKNSEEDEAAKTMHPGPRGWENATKGAYNDMHARKRAKSDDKDPLAILAKAKGYKIESDILTPDELAKILRSNVGTEAAELFSKYAGFDALFTTQQAKSIWTLGDKADIPFRPNNLTINKALDKILANHPKYKNQVTVPGKTFKKIPMTPAELENVIKYLIKCVDEVDESGDVAKDPILTSINAALKKKLLAAPYHVDLMGADADLYEDVLNILHDRMKQSTDAM